MKRHITHILTAAAALLAVLGCTKNEPNTNGRLITMTAHEAGATKALLNADSFMAEGNQIKVYDYYTPTTGAATYYIPGATAQSGGSTASGTVWPFTGDTRYEWTEDGVHKFFGWLEKDNNGTGITANDFFDDDKTDDKSFGFNTTTHTLTIPSTKVSPTTAQFDFMYSDIEPRNLNDEPDYSQVNLGFYHLFTSFSIAAKNVAKYNDYILDYVEFVGVDVTNSATINYAGDDPVVTYGTGEAGGTPYRITLAEGLPLTTTLVDLSTRSSSERHYMLSWPLAARTVKINIGYRAKEINDDNYSTYTQSITLNSPLAAGKKNNLNLEFKDKEITLNYLVEPWTVDSEEIDFSDQVTVDEEGTITWDLSTVDNVDYTTGRVLLFDDPNIEAMCTFTILTPKGATWTASLISKEGHPDAFRFVDGTKYGTVGVRDTIKLAVTNQDPISPRHVCELLITVQTADGRTIVVDDALTPEKDEDGNETTYSRFQIVQNLIN